MSKTLMDPDDEFLECSTSSSDSNDNDETIKLSPARCRSVKEYDKELSDLKQENFNLKLRIYTLETEGITSINPRDPKSPGGITDYHSEVENLYKQINEKHELLCQAVKAMELQDSEYKKIVEEKENELKKLKEEYKTLEEVYNSAKTSVEELNNQNEKLVEEVTHLSTSSSDLKNELALVKEQNNKLDKNIEDLETQLHEEKEHNIALENELKELDCMQLRCNHLEVELKEKNTKIDSLSAEIETNGRVISSCKLRIRTLEDILNSKNSDIKFKDKEVIQRDRVIQEQTSEIEELRRLVEEGNALCDKEQRHAENLKSAVMSRDNTIAELEGKLEKCKNVIRTYESKLDSISHENKRYKDELITVKQQRRFVRDSADSKLKLHDHSPRSNVSSINSPSTTSKFSDLSDSGSKSPRNLKLEEENKKAMALVQSLINHSKHLEKRKETLESNLAEKDQEISRLKKEKYLLLNSRPSASQNSDENSVEDPNDSKCINLLDTTDVKWIQSNEKLMTLIKLKEDEIEELKETYKQKLQDIEEQNDYIKNLQNEVKTMQSKHTYLLQLVENCEKTIDKDEKIAQLEKQVSKQTFNLQGIVNTELWDKNRQIEKLQNQCSAKDQKISELDVQVALKTDEIASLNSKIFKLEEQVNATTEIVSHLSSENMDDVLRLTKRIKSVDKDLKRSYEIIEQQQETLNHQKKESITKITELEDLIRKLQSDLEKSEKGRLFTVHSCNLMTERLEELAYFLNSLLKDKSVLGLLGNHERMAIKSAIDKSLDLSKSLPHSMLEDQSLIQLSSLSGILNTSDNDNSVSFTNCSEKDVDCLSLTTSYLEQGDGRHNYMVQEQAEIIKILQSQINVMENEIKLRDTQIKELIANKSVYDEEQVPKNDKELVDVIMTMHKSAPNITVMSPDKIYHDLIGNKSCPIIRTPVDNQSESEAWSEPDRHVSRNRIGLNMDTLNNSSNNSFNRCRLNKSTSTNKEISESTEEEEISLNKSSSKRSSATSLCILQENIASLEFQLMEKESEVAKLKSKLLEIESHDYEHKLMEEKAMNLKLQEGLTTYDNTICEVFNNLRIQEKKNKILVSKIAKLEKILSENNIIQENIAALNSSLSELEKQSTEIDNELKDNEIVLFTSHLREEHKKLQDAKLKLSQDIAKLTNEKMDLEILLRESEAQLKNVSEHYDELMKEKMDIENVLSEIKENLKISLEQNVQLINEKSKLENSLKEAKEQLINSSEFANSLEKENLNIKTKLTVTEEKLGNVSDQNDALVSKYQFVLQEKLDLMQEIERGKLLVHELKDKLNNLDNKICSNLQEYESNLSKKDDHWKAIIEKVEEDAELKIKSIENVVEKLKKQYESDWIQKCELNKHIIQIEMLSQDLKITKDLLKASEDKVSYFQDIELELKKQLDDTEEKINILKQELKETQLRASEESLKLTKTNSEKLKLESEVWKLEKRETEKIEELQQIKRDFLNTKNNLQKQINKIIDENSLLQIKLSEMEVINADLQNRLMKFHTSENVCTQTSATNIPKMYDFTPHFKVYGKQSLPSYPEYLRQRSDISGYASEDDAFNRSAPAAFNWFNLPPSAANPEIDPRNTANSSPDLGIESDQGRFSSLETNTVPRPLLQTLELTESMNNLLSDTNLNVRNNYCNIPEHGLLEKENVDLKEKVSKLQLNLSKTMQELAKINKSKKQVEKGICKQIQKTSLVLKQARANLDSSSENENAQK